MKININPNVNFFDPKKFLESRFNLIGFIKLVWYMLPTIMIIFMVMKKMKFSSGANNDNQCLLFTVLALCCGLSLWQLVDLIKFGFNKYRDGWGVPLKPFI